MPQVTIYLDEDTTRRVKKAARAAGVSLSKWIASALRQKTDTSWPQAVLDLEGAWPDFPGLHELREAEPKDVKREEL